MLGCRIWLLVLLTLSHLLTSGVNAKRASEAYVGAGLDTPTTTATATPDPNAATATRRSQLEWLARAQRDMPRSSRNSDSMTTAAMNSVRNEGDMWFNHEQYRFFEEAFSALAVHFDPEDRSLRMRLTEAAGVAWIDPYECSVFSLVFYPHNLVYVLTK